MTETPTPSASAEIREAVPSRAARAIGRAVYRDFCNGRLSDVGCDYEGEECAVHAAARTEATIRSEPASAAQEAPPVQDGQEREAVARIVYGFNPIKAPDESGFWVIVPWDQIRENVSGNYDRAKACYNTADAILALLPTDARAAAVEQPASEVVQLRVLLQEHHDFAVERLRREGKTIASSGAGKSLYDRTVAALAATPPASPSAAPLDRRDGEMREAAINAALCLSGFAGEGLQVVGFADPADVYCALTKALGMPDADDDDLRLALSSSSEPRR